MKEIPVSLRTKIIERRFRWVSELTSDKYTQGRMSLHSIYDGNEKFCCLGVACHMPSVSTETGIWTKKDTRDSVYRYADTIEDLSYPNSRAYMPASVRKYFGLSKDSEKMLTRLNDNDVPFKVIAEIVPMLPIDVED